MSRLILILATALLLTPPSLANLDPDKAVFPPHCDMTTALARAEDLYRDGKLTQALHWVERAHEILAVEIALGGDPAGNQLSNTRQLLKYLDIYGDYAYGLDQKLDETHDFLIDQLEIIDAIESGGMSAASLAGLDFRTWPDGQVLRVGDVQVGHWADGRIHRIGSYHIRYWANGLPINIGGIYYRYGSSIPWPERVASVDLD